MAPRPSLPSAGNFSAPPHPRKPGWLSWRVLGGQLDGERLLLGRARYPASGAAGGPRTAGCHAACWRGGESRCGSARARARSGPGGHLWAWALFAGASFLPSFLLPPAPSARRFPLPSAKPLCRRRAGREVAGSGGSAEKSGWGSRKTHGRRLGEEGSGRCRRLCGPYRCRSRGVACWGSESARVTPSRLVRRGLGWTPHSRFPASASSGSICLAPASPGISGAGKDCGRGSRAAAASAIRAVRSPRTAPRRAGVKVSHRPGVQPFSARVQKGGADLLDAGLVLAPCTAAAGRKGPRGWVAAEQAGRAPLSFPLASSPARPFAPDGSQYSL